MFTTADSLVRSEDFLAFCRTWQSRVRCPLPFADWLLENVGQVAFEAAMWANQYPPRPDIRREKPNGKRQRIRTYPEKLGDWWNWWPIDRHEKNQTACDVPISGIDVESRFGSFAESIAHYLFRFDLEKSRLFPVPTE